MLLAMMTKAVSLSMIHWSVSGDLLIMLLVGGLGTLFGAIFGSVVIVMLEHQLTTIFPGTWLLFIGVIFIAIVLLAPEGLYPPVRDGIEKLRDRL